MNLTNLTQNLNKWSTLIDFLISLETETIFTRQELLNYMSTKGFNSKSIDTYRRFLTKAGYLETITRGIYVIKRRIPFNTSISEVRQKAYGLVLEYTANVPPTSAGHFIFENGSTVFITPPHKPSKRQLKKKPEEFIKKEEMQL